jgi:TonB family protein
MMNIHIYTRRRISLILGLFAFFTVLPTKLAFSQTNGKSSAARKLVSQVEPEYPDTLRRNFIGGAVRVEATINPNGMVENTQLLGGNPILGQAAMKAIKQWKYAPSGTWDKVIVRVNFDPRGN